MSEQRSDNDPDHTLLVWPSWLLQCEDKSFEADTHHGFLVGHSKEGTALAQTVVVVAGIVWVDTNNVQQDYADLLHKIALLKNKLMGDCYCSCNSRSNNYQYQAGNDLEVVAYFSNQSSPKESAENAIDISIEEWVAKMGLPTVRARDGYPHLESCKADTDGADHQVLLYDPQKVYRHDLSNADSTFGSILEQITAASCLVHQLSHVSVDPQSPSKPKAKSDPSAVVDDKNIENGGGILKFLERNSMATYHFLSIIRGRRSRLGWTPVARLWQHHMSKREMDCCWHCHKIRLQTKLPQTDATNEWISDAADLAVGILIGFLGWWYYEWALTFYVHQPFLPQWLDWLESFPIGFKLNESFTHAIGQEIRSLVLLRQSILQSLADTAAACLSPLELYKYLPRLLVLLMSTILGGSGCLALWMDGIRLLTLHLTLLSEGFRYVYSTEIYLLGTSWRLFRGKKQNVLRHRTDTMEYDSMQLLLGSILFVMTLFLLTTILVYYIFFTVLNLVAGAGSTVVLWLVYVLLQDFPCGTCYFRLRHPEVFTSRVLIDETPPTSDGRIITSLHPVPESMGSILKAIPTLSMRAQCFSSWLGALFSDIFSGTPTSKSIVESLAFSS